MLNYCQLINFILKSNSIPALGLANSRFYSKEFNVLHKIMNKGGKKRQWRDFESRQGQLMPASAIARGPESNKRVTVLNKLLMKNITDLMATGICSERLAGLGIQVTKVKVGSEYNIVNVYWSCSGDIDHEFLESTLRRAAGELRQELIGLNVLGKVPHVQFVHDRSVAGWATVEHLLKTADFGEDFVPKGVAMLKADFGNERVAPLATEEKANGANDLPEMRQNVLGLDRSAILERVLSGMKGRSTKKVETLRSAGGDQSQYEAFNQEAFAEFLKTRKIARDRVIKYGGDDRRTEDDNQDKEDFSASDDDDYWEEDCYEDSDLR